MHRKEHLRLDKCINSEMSLINLIYRSLPYRLDFYKIERVLSASFNDSLAVKTALPLLHTA